MNLQEFIDAKIASATPGRTGWKARRLPHWRREFFLKEAERKEAERKDSVEAYWASPEGLAKLAAQRKLVEKSKERALLKKSRHMCRLEVGEMMTLHGSFNPLQEGDVVSNGWIGEDFFSYSEGTRAQCTYIPYGIHVKVLSAKRGCPLSFGRVVIERIK